MKLKLTLSLLSIWFIALVAGCDTNKSNPSTGKGSSSSGEHVHADGTVHKDHGDGHSHGEGPHGGVIADWGGGKFHVEFTVDHDQKQSIVYILGEDEKTSVPIDATEMTLAIKDPPTQVTLIASPQEGDPAGKSSRFVGKHDNLGIVREFEGAISGLVGGVPYSGNFKEIAHDHDH